MVDDSAESALRESEARLRGIIDAALDAVIAIDAHGSIMEWNSQAEAIFGWSCREVAGQALTETIIPPQYREAHVRGLKHFLATGEGPVLNRRIEISALHRDGHEFPVELAISAARSGATFTFSAFVRDISERKQSEAALRESEQRFRGAFETSPIGMALVAPDGQWLQINRRVCEITGYSEEELLSHTFQDITHPDDLEQDLSYVRQMLAGELLFYQMEKRYLHKTGRVVWIHLSVSLVRDAHGTPLYFVSQIEDITDRKQATEALRQSEDRYRDLVQNSNDVILTHALDGELLSVNPAVTRFTGYSQDELLQMNMRDLLAPEVRDQFDDYMARIREAGSATGSVLVQDKSGGKHILEYDNSLRAQDDAVTIVRSRARDVTDQKRAERVQSALYRIAEVTNAAEDLDSFYAELHRIISELMYAKNFYIALADDASGEIRFPYFVDEFDPPPPPIKLGQGLTGHIISTGEPLLLAESEIMELAAGSRVEPRGANPVHWLGVPLRSGDRTFGVLAVQSYTAGIRYGEREKDLLVFVSQHIAAAIEKKRTEKQIEHLAFQDALTGLPNRISLDHRLDVALAIARRERHRLAVLFIDLDRFKVINDSLGHRVGDLLLKGVAERLSRTIRGSDTFSRLGGDEFVLLLSKVDRAESAGRVAQKVQQSLRKPFDVAGRELFVTLSTGISVFPEDGDDADTLLKHADTAMYAAKQNGRDTFQFYSHIGHATGTDRLDLETQLHRAIEKEELTVHFQPVVRLLDGEVVNMEALVRWQHPTRGLVLPGSFIPLAEDSGLIFELGAFVLKAACRQTLSWRTRWNRDLSVSVNLSARQLLDRRLVSAVRRILEETGLPADALSLEITESIAMQNLEVSLTTLGALGSLGVGIVMDDFGTGFSSLSYLKILPVDTIKIDRSFIRDVATDPNDASIVRASIVMAHELRLRVVAEGVENAEQLRFLRGCQCDDLQGFLYSPAVAPPAFEALIEGRKRLPV